MRLTNVLLASCCVALAGFSATADAQVGTGIEAKSVDYYAGSGELADVELVSLQKDGGKGCDDDCGKGCDHGCGCSCFLFGPDEPWTMMPENECRRWNVGGWFQFGYHSDETPLSTTFGDGAAFNDVPGRLNMQQAWLYIEREADGECGWDWGYRADIMYGTDAQKTQAFGNPPGIPGGGPRRWDNQLDHGVYGWAIPQAYVEVANGNLSIKAGHFFTLVGYEVITAPGNFFYSHALTMFNSEPFTHTGVVATYTVNDRVEVYGGWTLGWDTGFDQFDDGNSWLGGFKYSFNDCASVTYISTAGNFGQRGREAYSHSIVFDFNLTDRLEWVVQSDYVSITRGNNPVPTAIPMGTGNDQVGINQYLFYTINDCWKAGVRAEWWKSDGQSFNEVTCGVNYRPHANIVLRPEYRYDFGNAPLSNGTKNAVSIFGIDAIVTF